MSSDAVALPLNRPLLGLKPGPPRPASRCDAPARGAPAAREALDRARREVAEKARRLDDILGRVGGLLRGLERAQRDLLRGNEREIIALSLTVAEKVVQHEIAEGRYRIGAIVRAAREAVRARGAVTVKVNPADLDAARAALEKDPADGEHTPTVVADPAVPPAGCAVETSAGRVFTEAASRLDLIRKSLLNHAAEPGGPAEAVRPAPPTPPGDDHDD